MTPQSAPTRRRPSPPRRCRSSALAPLPLLRAARAHAFLLAAGALLLPQGARASSWENVDPRDPALRAPTVAPEADAEVILWEMEVRDEGSWESSQSTISHHVLVKVFNERGRDAQSRVDIPYGRGVRVTGIAARTIHPDGTVVELKKDAVFDQTIAKAAGVKVKAKSFVFLAAEPGSILEYKYRLVESGGLTHYVRLDLQRSIPVRRLVLRLKPLVFPGSNIAMRYRSFNAAFPAPALDAEGFATSVLTNVPAFEAEPYMPPEGPSRGFVFLYYGELNEPTVEDYWRNGGRRLYDMVSGFWKPGDAVRDAARGIAAGARAPEEQLRLLHAYCTTQIRNTDDPSVRAGEESVERKESRDPKQTLRRGVGTPGEINLLFAAMAAALDLDVRIAFLANKTETVFQPDQKLLGVLTETCVAVRLPSGWSFYSPGARHVAFGRLPWWLEGQDAFLPDPGEPRFVKTPFCPAEASLTRRAATLRLAEDGSLEGDARVESWGHAAWRTKEEYADASHTRKVESLREKVRERIPDAEITSVAFGHIADDSLPCVVSYHVRVPDYAQRTASGILLEPDFFGRGNASPFTAKIRRYPVDFAYATETEDSVTFSLPDSMEVVRGSASEPLVVRGVGNHFAQVLVGADGRSLCYRNTLRVGDGGSLRIPRDNYPRVKDFFDHVQAAADETVLLHLATAPP